MHPPASGSCGDFGRHCLNAFRQVVPASQGAFYRIDAHLQAYDFILLDMLEPMHDAYLRHYRHVDPLRPDHCQAAGLPVVPLRTGLAQQSEADNRKYRRFLQHHAVVDVVEIIAHVDGKPSAGVSLLRGAGLGPFRPEELQCLLPLHGLMELAARSQPPSAGDRLTALTPRERELALLLRDGLPNKLLARQLGLGLPTIKTHLLHLYRKLGVSNRTELISSLFL